MELTCRELCLREQRYERPAKLIRVSFAASVVVGDDHGGRHGQEIEVFVNVCRVCRRAGVRCRMNMCARAKRQVCLPESCTALR